MWYFKNGLFWGIRISKIAKHLFHHQYHELILTYLGGGGGGVVTVPTFLSHRV